MAEIIEEREQASSYRWVVMGLWIFCSVSSFMVVSTLGIMLPAISTDLSLSPGQQGMLASSAFWGNFALAIPLSWWTSRYGPKTLTTVTLVLGTGFLFLQGFASTFLVLLAGRVAFGIVVIARQPARAILTQQWFHPREVVLVNSISNALFGLVVGGGLVASPFILASLGDDWKATLQSFGGLFVVLSILWMALGRNRTDSRQRAAQVSQEEPNETGVVWGTLRYRDLWVGGLGFLGATLGWSAFLSFFPTLMLEEYGLSLAWSGAMMAVTILVGGIAGLGFSYAVMVTDRGKEILQILGVVMAATYVGMALTGSIPLLMVLSLVNGIAWGFWPILYTVPFHLPAIRPRQVAVGLAFTTMMTSAGIALGPLITGFLQDGVGGLRPALIIVSFTGLSLTAAGAILPRRFTDQPLPQPAAEPTG
ncbi:MAG: hypothetical protein BZY88_12285 [SAR202 cluster bacterium Io17-Chloro-G9]|nr:MAG: hypothetical protein BZY88_12285 [SAR202 cluster bacterium Io17-Chloro-G9]